MILKTINPGVHHAKLIIENFTYDNSRTEKMIGWDEIEATHLKIKCMDCTLMVFGKDDMSLFKHMASGDNFKALIHDGKYKNVYKFKQMI